ncbi:receptor activity-modifying protein 1 [Sphaeramia orbicularis]|uniref:Receptor activity-modifying protein 1-like n=1 Tax=Sphaeramia orbicularis TaxID=375764 RepID=A0A672ZRK1_9TELE|nr:receptor activity-modifying protein 1-like [Sphaeramia orbicularis]
MMVPRVSGQPQRLLSHTSPPSTMGLYLLLHLLILGIVESQTSNITLGMSNVEEKLRFQLSNQTSMDNSTMSRVNGTFSYDELTKIEEELNTQSNQTVITEDDENFQSWENEQRPGHCQEKLLLAGIHAYCASPFHEEMLTLNWCVLEDVIRPYNDMTICVENWSYLCHCFFPNQNIQEFFLEVHSYYFQNCPKEEFELEDAPQWLVVTLTIVPVSLIPALVYLVVQKSKEQE